MAGLVLAAVVTTGVVLVSANRRNPAGGLAQANPGCTESTVVVVTSPDLSDVLAALAEEFNAGEPGEGGCAAVAVEGRGSSEMAAALSDGYDEGVYGLRPDVWIPDSATFVELVRSSQGGGGLLPAQTGDSIARSPTVVGMPRPLAEAAGWPGSQLGWADLMDLVQDAGGWAERGHPEWGAFKLGMADPQSSPAGLHALLSIGAAESGVWTDALSEEGLADDQVRRTLLALDRGVAQRSNTVTQQLLALRQADREGQALTFVSALPLSERDVWRYNRGLLNPGLASEGPPQVPLVALYPPEGGLAFDYPYQVLQGADGRAGDFFDFLRRDGAQRRLQEAGFRDAENRPGDVLAKETEELNPERAGAAVPPPAGVAVQAALGGWRAVSQEGVTLAVMDVSGSMEDPVPGTDRRILDVAVQSAVASLELFRPDSTVGLWQFSTGLPGCPQDGDWCELVPLGPLGEDLDGSARRDRIVGALQGLQPANDTALYDTILSAYEGVQAAYRPDELNSVLLFTDGRSDGDQLTLDALLAALRERQNPSKPVQVVLIAYGNPDVPALQAITDLTGGAVFTPSSPDQVADVFLQALTGQ